MPPAMAKKEEPAGPEIDADGLAVQKYVSTVLVVVPPKGFGEQALRGARSSLYNVHIGTRTVSTQAEALVQGRLQDEFLVDGTLAGETIASYSGVLFAGGEGSGGLEQDPDCLRLAREAAGAGKLVAAYGDGVAVLARAGVIRGRRITGPARLADEIRRAGGRPSSRQVEIDGPFVTGLDETSAIRFGKALVQAVAVR